MISTTSRAKTQYLLDKVHTESLSITMDYTVFRNYTLHFES